MNKISTGHKIQADKSKIIELYQAGVYIAKIALEYGVAVGTMYRYIRQWGVPRRSRPRQHQKKTVKKFYRYFSPELKAQQEENTKVNDKYIKQVEFEHSTEDQKLIANILSHPIIG